MDIHQHVARLLISDSKQMAKALIRACWAAGNFQQKEVNASIAAQVINHLGDEVMNVFEVTP